MPWLPLISRCAATLPTPIWSISRQVRLVAATFTAALRISCCPLPQVRPALRTTVARTPFRVARFGSRALRPLDPPRPAAASRRTSSRIPPHRRSRFAARQLATPGPTRRQQQLAWRRCSLLRRSLCSAHHCRRLGQQLLLPHKHTQRSRCWHSWQPRQPLEQPLASVPPRSY